MLLISKGSPDADQRKRWDTAYDIAISSIIVLSWYKFALTVEVMDQRYTFAWKLGDGLLRVLTAHVTDEPIQPDPPLSILIQQRYVSCC